MRLIRVFAVLLICVSMMGCGLRALTDRDVPGTYGASARLGSSTLVLHPDHSFDQTVVRNDHSRRA